jgi:hypothetical protein
LVLLLYCLNPAERGGETTIYNGAAILNALKPSSRLLFEERRLMFEPSLTRKEWLSLAPNRDKLVEFLDRFRDESFRYEFDENATLFMKYCVSAIRRSRDGKDVVFSNSLLDSKNPRFEDGSLVPRPVLHEVIGVTEKYSVPISWCHGDLLIVDNIRFMHGRREFSDVGREIVVRFSNIAG